MRVPTKEKAENGLSISDQLKAMRETVNTLQFIGQNKGE